MTNKGFAITETLIVVVMVAVISAALIHGLRNNSIRHSSRGWVGGWEGSTDTDGGHHED